MSSTREDGSLLGERAARRLSQNGENQAYKTLVVPGDERTMHIADIGMSWSTQGPFYKAHATVTIVDANDAPIEGAIVSGTWSGAYIGDGSGVTDASGQVTLDSDKVKNGGTFTFTVVDVTKTGWTYDSATNIETSDSVTCP